LKVSNINFTKIHPVGADLTHVDRQTDSGDMKKLTGAFREKTCDILKTPLFRLIWFPHSYLRCVFITWAHLLSNTLLQLPTYYLFTTLYSDCV